MASDERDTDERGESDDRRGESGDDRARESPAGPDPGPAGDASDGGNRYANAGREPSDARQQTWRAGDPSRSSAPERPPEGRRYGSEGRPASQRPGRRYGSRPSSQRELPAQRESPDRREPPSRPPGDEARGPPEERAPSGEPAPSEGRRSGAEDRPAAPRDETGRSEPQDFSEQSGEPGRIERSDPEEGSEPEVQPGAGTPPKRTQPMREPSVPMEESSNESEGEAEGESDAEPPRYGGPLDSNWGRRSPTERERAQREYERRLDRKFDQQRRFQVDKSGNRYRRR